MTTARIDTNAAREVLAKMTPAGWEVHRRYSNECEIVPRITCAPDSDRGCGWIADMIGAPYLGHESTIPNADGIAFLRNNAESWLNEIDRLAAHAAAAVKADRKARAEEIVSRLREKPADLTRQESQRLVAEDIIKGGRHWLSPYIREHIADAVQAERGEIARDLESVVNGLLNDCGNQPGAMKNFVRKAVARELTKQAERIRARTPTRTQGG